MRVFKLLKYLRFIFSGSFLALFTYIFIRSLDPFSLVTNYFLRFDPLIFLTNIKNDPLTIGIISLIFVLTLLLGRFFCGWICPMGTLIEIIDFITRIIPFGSALFRTKKNQPLNFTFIRHSPSLFILAVIAPTIFFMPPVLQFFHPNIWIVRIFSLSLSGIIFLTLLIVTSLISRRFWCRYICPLGALYGLIAKFSIFSLKIKSCSHCTRCNACPMGAANYKTGEIIKSQCILCFEYEYSCPTRGFEYSLHTLPPNLPKPAFQTYSPSRRNFLRQFSTLVGGLAIGSILSTIETRTRTKLLRPPGVVDETEFIERCLRCFQCVRSCPNKIIKITGVEAGFSNFLTPHLSFEEYGCDYYCQVCQTVCPNGAIPLQSLKLKQITPIGKAKIDTSLCVVYKKATNCLVCEEFCPIPEKAIVPIEKRVTKDKKSITLRYPLVITSRCNGCGICEANCPVTPKAIQVFKKPI